LRSPIQSATRARCDDHGRDQKRPKKPAQPICEHLLHSCARDQGQQQQRRGRGKQQKNLQHDGKRIGNQNSERDVVVMNCEAAENKRTIEQRQRIPVCQAHSSCHDCKRFGENRAAAIGDLSKPRRDVGWRRGRDSNPRYGCPYAAFRVRCIQPLCHLSARREKRSSGPAVFSGGRSWKQAIRQGGASRVGRLTPDNALTVRARACDRANTGRRHVARWQSTTGPTAAHIRSRA
jgi:hypothetical protein